jgi:hypothetical protein
MRHSPSSHRAGVLGAVGRTCDRHRWLPLAAWIVGTACRVRRARGGQPVGWLHQLFGFPEKVPVTTWVPMFLFVILFGLSMDGADASGGGSAGLARPPK